MRKNKFLKKIFTAIYAPVESMNRRATIFLACQIISQAVGFLISPLLTRLLLPAQYGRATMYVTYLSILTIFVSLQTSSTINNAKLDYDPRQIKAYLSSIIGLSLTTYAVFQLLFLIFQQPLSLLLGYDSYLIVLMPLVSIGNFGIGFALTLYIREKRAYIFMLISLSNAIFSALLSLLFIVLTTGDKASAKIIGYSIPSVAIGMIILAAYLLRGKTFYRLEYWKYCLTLTVPLMFANISGFINTQSDRLMLVKMTGATAVGVYSFAITMALPLYAIVNALNNTWHPIFFDLHREGNNAKLLTSSRNYQKLYTLLTIGFIFVCPEIIKIVATPKYYGTIDLVPLLAVAYYFNFINRFPMSFMVYHKKIKSISLATLISAIITVGLNFVLIPYFGSLGATITCAITGLLVWLLCEYFARHMGIRYQLFDYRLMIIGILLVLCVTFISQVLLPWWWIRWLLAIFTGLVLVFHVRQAKGLF